MTNISAQGVLFFYLTIEGYRVSAEQQISAALLADHDNDKPDLDMLRDAALSIYNQYFSEKVSNCMTLSQHTSLCITTIMIFKYFGTLYFFIRIYLFILFILLLHFIGLFFHLLHFLLVLYLHYFIAYFLNVWYSYIFYFRPRPRLTLMK